jgi:hypothetical protein
LGFGFLSFACVAESRVEVKPLKTQNPRRKTQN